MENHIIFDMETLSNNSLNGVMLDCSIVRFSFERFISEKPYTLAELIRNSKKMKVSVKDQTEKYGYKVEKSTLEWWMQQSKEAQKCIKPLSSDIDVDVFVDQFIEYISMGPKVKYWWTRSNTFDPLFIQRMAMDTNKMDRLAKVLPFWGVRDTRTFIDAKLDFPKENGFIPFKDEEKWKRVFIAHDSRMDIAADVLRMQAIMRAECDLEPIE